jgi:hypothetical protein
MSTRKTDNDEAEIFTKPIIDDTTNTIDQTLPTAIKLVKEIGYNNPGVKIPSKNEVFIEIMETLEDECTGLVDINLLVSKLEKTGLFPRLKARSYLTRMYRDRIIEEPKSGFFRLLYI